MPNKEGNFVFNWKLVKYKQIVVCVIITIMFVTYICAKGFLDLEFDWADIKIGSDFTYSQNHNF